MKKSRTPTFVLICLAVTLTQSGTAAANDMCRPGSYRFSGSVQQGQTFRHPFGGFVFMLLPNQYGWDIDISLGEEHFLANITGPRHFVPTPIEIEGWHFRNAANTGVNNGDVNAPQSTRRFLFSPRWPHCEDAPGLEKDGQGRLEITHLELGNLVPGEKASIRSMSFKVYLRVGSSACANCPGQ